MALSRTAMQEFQEQLTQAAIEHLSNLNQLETFIVKHTGLILEQCKQFAKLYEWTFEAKKNEFLLINSEGETVLSLDIVKEKYHEEIQKKIQSSFMPQVRVNPNNNSNLPSYDANYLDQLKKILTEIFKIAADNPKSDHSYAYIAQELKKRTGRTFEQWQEIARLYNYCLVGDGNRQVRLLDSHNAPVASIYIAKKNMQHAQEQRNMEFILVHDKNKSNRGPYISRKRNNNSNNNSEADKVLTFPRKKPKPNPPSESTFSLLYGNEREEISLPSRHRVETEEKNSLKKSYHYTGQKGTYDVTHFIPPIMLFDLQVNLSEVNKALSNYIIYYFEFCLRQAHPTWPEEAIEKMVSMMEFDLEPALIQEKKESTGTSNQSLFYKPAAINSQPTIIEPNTPFIAERYKY